MLKRSRWTVSSSGSKSGVGSGGAGDAEHGVELVYVAVRCHALMVLRHAPAAEQPRLALIAGPGIDLHDVCLARRMTASISPVSVIFSRGAPRVAPAPHSWASSACQSRQLTTSTPRAIEECRDRFGVGNRGFGKRTPVGVFEQAADRLDGVRLVGSDHAARPPLDPSRHIAARDHRATGGGQHAPPSLGMTARRSSNGTPFTGSARYPTDRKTRPTGSCRFLPVATA